MKKQFASVVASLLLVTSSSAQEKISGTIAINYASRVELDASGAPQLGVKDTYTFDNVMVSTLAFKGIIENQPGIYSKTTGMEAQPAYVKYALDAVVKNPANLAQEKKIGKMIGAVQIDRKGVYLFDSGNVRFAIDGAGAAAGFDSAFRGRVVGKPPRTGSLLEKMKAKAMTITKQVKGQTIKIVVNDFDKMSFQGLVLAAGPVKAYPETVASGDMIYDYERGAWYFTSLVLEYTLDGKVYRDKITGNIKWSESPQRATNGEGQYDFDVRVNEPVVAPSESQVFAAVEDEAAFFSTDVSIPGITGAMRYKDRIVDSTVQSSAVTLDLTGNQLSKQQMVALYKLIMLVSVVPLNAE